MRRAGAFPRSGAGLAGLAVWLQCLAGVAGAVTAGSDAPANFQCYFINPEGTTRTVTCGTDSIFAQSSTFGGCCRIGGNCNFPTACHDAVLTNRLGGTAKCAKTMCYTMTVYADFPTATDSWIVHNCANTWTASTLWRGMPTATETGTETETGSSSSSSGVGETASSATDGAAVEGPGVTTSGGVEATGSAGAVDGNGDGGDDDSVETGSSSLSSSSSQAWIAGVVLGAVAVAVALGALGFWLGMRRRRRRSGEQGGSGDAGGGGGGGEGRGFKLFSVMHVRSGGRGGYNDASPISEIDSMAKLRNGAIVIAHGVEMEAGRSHVELEAAPVPGKLFR